MKKLDTGTLWCGSASKEMQSNSLTGYLSVRLPHSASSKKRRFTVALVGKLSPTAIGFS